MHLKRIYDIVSLQACAETHSGFHPCRPTNQVAAQEPPVFTALLTDPWGHSGLGGLVDGRRG